MTNIAIENGHLQWIYVDLPIENGDLQWICPLKMVDLSIVFCMFTGRGTQIWENPPLILGRIPMVFPASDQHGHGQVEVGEAQIHGENPGHQGI